MRTVWRLLLLLLLLAGGYVYLYGGKLGDVKSALEEVTAHHGPITVYRWRDRDGNWVYGSEPPPGVKYETRTVNPDKNVAPSVPTGEKKDGGSILPFSQEDIRKMFEHATDLTTHEEKSGTEQRAKQKEN